MEKKLRVQLIVVNSFLIGVIGLILCLFTGDLYLYIGDLLNFITSLIFLAYLDVIVAFLLLILYLYYLIRQLETSSYKNFIAVIEIVLGGIIIGFPMLDIIYIAANAYPLYLEGLITFVIYTILIYSLLFLPGVSLIVYGRLQLKRIKKSTYNLFKNLTFL